MCNFVGITILTRRSSRPAVIAVEEPLCQVENTIGNKEGREDINRVMQMTKEDSASSDDRHPKENPA